MLFLGMPQVRQFLADMVPLSGFLSRTRFGFFGSGSVQVDEDEDGGGWSEEGIYGRTRSMGGPSERVLGGERFCCGWRTVELKPIGSFNMLLTTGTSGFE